MTEEKYVIELKRKMNQEEKSRVLEINFENLDRNGGELHYEGILSHDYVALAKYKDEVIAYALLEENFITKGDIYAMQIAVDGNYKNKGIGSNLYDYVYRHAKGYKVFTASVNPSNIVSQKFHEKSGFEVVGQNNLGLLYVRPIKKDAGRSFFHARKEEFNFITKDAPEKE